MKIVVLGYIVRGPLGGMVWNDLNYLVGLARLGHEVLFLEDSGESEWCCYDPSRGVSDADPTYGLAFTDRVFRGIGMAGQWAYHDAHRARFFGPAADRAVRFCAGADVLLNLACINPLRPWVERIPVRVLVDHDPAFTQVRHLTDPVALALARRHTAFFSFGENIGRPECTVPDDGLPWRPTRPPVVLELWPDEPPVVDGSFTTVMQWESYPPLEHAGRRYGLKGESFASYLDLPRETGGGLELAVTGRATPWELLEERGWRLRDAAEISVDPWTYQRYIQESKAEWSVAKQGYVASRSGWFSERSADYLATGRPVVVEDTGFTRWLPTGEGVLAFDSPEGAAEAVARVQADYSAHCRAARRIAEEYFGAERVLADLLQEATGA